MGRVRHCGCALAAGVMLVVASTAALAQETLKAAIGQRGNWDTAVEELGQKAGIFKKHGIILELLYTQGGGETQQAVISGSVDIGSAAGTIGVLGAFAKGAPVRIIGAEATGASDYWYVRADSPIRSLKDTADRTIAYSTNGSSTHSIVRAFVKEYGLKAKPVATGGTAATFTQVMSGQIDVGWSAPPFGLDAEQEGKIRILARGNDIPAVRQQTVRLLIANAPALEKRKDAFARFMQAHREAIDWMYADPQALRSYAEFAGVSEAMAKRVRDEFFPKEMLLPDQISGLDAIMEEAVSFKSLAAPLTKDQVEKLIQIPPPLK
jgi:NitT/TauT family transport system substrate-binding protein